MNPSSQYPHRRRLTRAEARRRRRNRAIRRGGYDLPQGLDADVARRVDAVDIRLLIPVRDHVPLRVQFHLAFDQIVPRRVAHEHEDAVEAIRPGFVNGFFSRSLSCISNFRTSFVF